MKCRYFHMDCIKCLAMFFVVIYHSTFTQIDILTSPDLLSNVLYSLRGILTTCVPLFFFANGYLLVNKDLNLKAFSAKIGKLFLITLVWSYITVLYYEHVRGITLPYWDVLAVISEFRQDWTNHLWFLPALVGIYLLYPLVKTTFDYEPKRFYWFFIVACVFTIGYKALDIYFYILSYYQINSMLAILRNLLNRYNLFQYMPYGFALVYYMLGMIFGRKHLQIQASITTGVQCVSACILLISILAWGWIGIFYTKTQNAYWDLIWNGYDTIFTAIDVICVYILFSRLEHKGSWMYRLVEIISRNTLGIYFMHRILISFAILFVPHMNEISPILLAVMVVLISTGISMVMRKIPIVKRLVT